MPDAAHMLDCYNPLTNEIIMKIKIDVNIVNSVDVNVCADKLDIEARHRACPYVWYMLSHHIQTQTASALHTARPARLRRAFISS